MVREATQTRTHHIYTNFAHEIHSLAQSSTTGLFNPKGSLRYSHDHPLLHGGFARGSAEGI